MYFKWVCEKNREFTEGFLSFCLLCTSFWRHFPYLSHQIGPITAYFSHCLCSRACITYSRYTKIWQKAEKCILKKYSKKNRKFTEAFLCKRYFPDVTNAALLLTLTNCVILDRIFRTCFHPEFGLYCAKYAYGLLQLNPDRGENPCDLKTPLSTQQWMGT